MKPITNGNFRPVSGGLLAAVSEYLIVFDIDHGRCDERFDHDLQPNRTGEEYLIIRVER